MEKLINIENKKVGLKVSAGTIRRYRDTFGRDLIADMGAIESEIVASGNLLSLSVDSQKIAENALYIMARDYDPDIPDIEEWLDQFSPYFCFQAIGNAIGMWTENLKTLNKQKKK